MAISILTSEYDIDLLHICSYLCSSDDLCVACFPFQPECPFQ